MDGPREEYGRTARLMESFRLPLEALIKLLLEEQGIRVHGVTARVKSETSVLRKTQRTDRVRTLSDLTDLLGIRVITYFPDDVDAVANVIEREFCVDAENSVDKRAVLDPDRFGYLSLHYVLQLSRDRSRLPEYRAYRDVKFELQIRSILQHAWAEIEHDLGYKSEVAVPALVRRRFSRLAGLLELADSEFLGIREELGHSDTPPASFTDDVELQISQLLRNPPPFALPNWQEGWTESEYNTVVPHLDPRFLLLDRTLIPIPSSSGRFEPCDLLGPGNELIHVKQARNSASFGHLFNQALVSTEILLSFREARSAFAVAVADQGAGRELPPGFRPTDVVLAFPSRDSPLGSREQIPAFARITLARVARELQSYGVTLHLMGIKLSSPQGT